MFTENSPKSEYELLMEEAKPAFDSQDLTNLQTTFLNDPRTGKEKLFFTAQTNGGATVYFDEGSGTFVSTYPFSQR